MGGSRLIAEAVAIRYPTLIPQSNGRVHRRLRSVHQSAGTGSQMKTIQGVARSRL